MKTISVPWYILHSAHVIIDLQLKAAIDVPALGYTSFNQSGYAVLSPDGSQILHDEILSERVRGNDVKMAFVVRRGSGLYASAGVPGTAYLTPELIEIDRQEKH